MEHIVQFAIGIDDEAIKNEVMESAEKQIIENIEKDIKDAIFHKNYYGKRTNDLQAWVKVMIEKEIMKNKEEIIQLAVKELADRLARTKMAKEKLAEVLDGLDV